MTRSVVTGLAALAIAIVSGDDLVTLRPALDAATRRTPWRSEGRTYALTLRPLLPDESGRPTG